MASQINTVAAFEKSVFAFSIPLYNALEKKDNVFFSPYSVSAALMLLLLGTDGEAKSELEAALNLQGVTGLENHRGYNQLFKKLTSWSGEGILISIANRIFSKENVKICQDFSRNAMEFYDSEIEMLDFGFKAEDSRLRINAWVEHQTKDKIKDLIPQGLISSSTMMVLANAIYFKGDWELKFDARATTKQPFFIDDHDSIETELMFKNTNEVKSGESEELGCSCLQLPYKQGTFSMFVMLPNERNGLAALEEKLTPSSLQGAIENVVKQETNIYLPKFKLEASYNLKQTLPKIGITKIFDKSADFSAMFEDDGRNVCVTDAIHKAFVEVNEAGTEAAAATGMVVTCYMLVTPFEFRADHPFLFFIIDNESKTILFMGRYVKPN